MTFYEQELRKIVGEQYPDATYVGRACYVRLSDMNRAKIQFVTGIVANQYNALQMTILNRSEGQVDTLRLHFSDLLGTKATSNLNFRNGVDPHIWDDYGKVDWYVYHPTRQDYKILSDAVSEYLDVFQDKVPLYPYSAKDAMKRGELDKWRESFRENCACAGGIDILIRENFDGMHLKDGTVEKIVELYGYKRVEHVLANTVQERRGDGRFRPDNRAWAESHYIPEDEMHNYCFAARSHSAILDGFISNYRKLVMNLGMFDQKQCEPDSSTMDYTGKVLVLSPNTLKEEYWSPENQLWLAQSGFGCSPTARGRSILCTCLGDGEQTRWNRNDFIGVLKDEYLPDWAKEALKQYQRPEQEEKQEMQMGGM